MQFCDKVLRFFSLPITEIKQFNRAISQNFAPFYLFPLEISDDCDTLIHFRQDCSVIMEILLPRSQGRTMILSP